MKKKTVFVAGIVVVILLAAALIFGKILNVNGYGISVGRLYFADIGVYLIDNQERAMFVSDRSENKTLFEHCENGDKVILLHGWIAESYPAQATGYAAIRIGNGSNDYKPSDESLGIYELGPDGEMLTGETVEFSAQYIRTGWNDKVKYPAVKVIRSAEELKNYYNDNKDIHDLERRSNPASDSTVGFLDAADRYDEAYFEEQILIMVLLEEGSGSNRHKVDYVKMGSDGKLYINILSVDPEIGTCDMAGWHILIEPEKKITLNPESDVMLFLDGIDSKRIPKPVYAGKYLANISLTLFDGWEYAVCDENDGSGFWIELWPSERSEEKLKISYNESFGICGTGLEQTKIKLSQYDGFECRYTGDKLWSFIIFEGTPGSYVIYNEGAEKWWAEYGNDAMKILGTLKLADGIIFKEEAIRIAKNNCAIEYERVDAKYDSFSGEWAVTFYKADTAGGDLTVTMSHEGKLVNLS